MPLKAFFLCAKPCVRSVLPRAVGITRHPLDELRNESLDDGFGDAERSEAGGGHRALRGLGELGRLDPGFEVSNGGELERAKKAPRRCQRGTLESRGFGARSIGVTHAALECLYCADVLARILVAGIEGRGRGALLAKWEASLPANKVNRSPRPLGVAKRGTIFDPRAMSSTLWKARFGRWANPEVSEKPFSRR